MASFDGTTIYILQRDRSLPLDYDSEISVRHIPGGDSSVVDLGGKTLAGLSLPLRFANQAAFDTIAAKRQTQGTLVYDAGTYTAILKRLRQTRYHKDGTNEADAEFVIIS